MRKDADMRRARIIFVCTWKDTREKDGDYGEIIANVKDMVFGITNTEIPFFDVSAKKYLSGVSKNAQALQESSGILKLRDYLDTYAAGYLENKQRMDREELQQLADEMKERILQQRGSKEKEKQKIVNRVEEKFESRRKAWWAVFDNFAQRRKQLAGLQTELDD